MQYFYQPITRALFIDELSNIPTDAYRISEEDYLKIISTAVSISGDDSPDWYIPEPMER